MALWDTADLLDRCKDKANRPSADEQMDGSVVGDDAKWYRLMTEGQSRAIRLLATHVPAVNYAAPVKLTTSDSGVTYDFPSSAEPLGLVEIRASPTGALLVPGPEFDSSTDIVVENDVIRFPGGKARTFGDGPYARFVTDSTEIANGTNPTLKPLSARILIVYDALRRWAEMTGNLVDPQKFEDAYQKEAWGSQAAEDIGIIGALKKQYLFAGSAAVSGPRVDWWTGLDTGAGYPTIQ